MLRWRWTSKIQKKWYEKHNIEAFVKTFLSINKCQFLINMCGAEVEVLIFRPLATHRRTEIQPPPSIDRSIVNAIWTWTQNWLSRRTIPC